LNSLLILSKLLSDNTQKNLTEKQVEFSRTIHHAGTDLLGLINDILDLSKIESGTVTLDVGETSFAAVADHMDRTFAQLAQDKRITFSVDIDQSLPRSMYTDDKRVQQIIKNLLSNAFKFTEKGYVRLRIERAAPDWSGSAPQLRNADQVVAFIVEDTGIGIPDDKQRIIFEAFQQADGTTSRKYGGTGLGLSISREITWLLGGELHVASVPGQGSAFTLYLPLVYSPQAQLAPRSGGARQMLAAASALAEEVEERVIDDRDSIEAGDPVVLIIEDDHRFASILLALAREAGFKGVVTPEGANVVALAKRFGPQAITLDIALPDMDGLALLDLLKRNPDTQHIPVHVISADEESRLGLTIGAYSFSGKPVEPTEIIAALDDVKTFRLRPKRLLAIDLGDSRGVLAGLIGNGDVEAKSVASLDDALASLRDEAFDCVVINMMEPETLSPDLLDALRTIRTPVVAFASGTIADEEEARLRQLGRAGRVVKVVRSTPELVDAAALILHRSFEALPDDTQMALRQLRRSEPSLAGRKVVIIDDDVRNIFSLTSALEEHGVELHFAESGRAGIELLRRMPDADIALVDIMMPGLDGYETIREIRSIPELDGMPIVAVTAKAMKGDRQKCIEAGASDYVAKPVDMDQLVSVLRVWLQRAEQGMRARSGSSNVVAFPQAIAGQG
jgi:CheY-like chemotaxis protein